MFRFIHTYTEDSFEGLFKSGLWHEGDGLKLMHKNYLPEEKAFNSIAKKDGLLYRRLSELHCEFYIDRYQGGIGFPYKYDYDSELLDEYKALLGEKFLGFQLHEWASNYGNENLRVLEAEKNWRENNPDSPLSAMWQRLIKEIRTNTTALFTEAWSVEEWSEMKHPESCDEFIAELHRLWKKRSEETGCPLIPADSYYMAPKLEIKFGAKILLPEIGWQIGGTRLQIAYNRGMAKAAEIQWGVYYECWGAPNGDGKLSIPYSANSPNNEWHETKLLDQITKVTNGKTENGGSSRSLQERCWIYSYFSGAEIMGEEYGVCNTFRNYNDFELSEYGKVKKKLLDFVSEHQDLGKTYTPIAIVLPKELDIYTLNDAPKHYLGFPVSDKGFADKLENMRAVIGRIFDDNYTDNAIKGTDSHCLQNSPYPDVFDIIHADMTDAIDKYDYLIDLTGDSDFSSPRSNIISVDDVLPLTKKMLPCTLDNNLHYVFNKKGNGWFMLVMNNNGVDRSGYSGDRFIPEAAITSEVHLNSRKANLSTVAGNGKLLCESGKYSLEMSPGSWIIIKIN